jgi:hypothetical protein
LEDLDFVANFRDASNHVLLLLFRHVPPSLVEWLAGDLRLNQESIVRAVAGVLLQAVAVLLVRPLGGTEDALASDEPLGPIDLHNRVSHVDGGVHVRFWLRDEHLLL